MKAMALELGSLEPVWPEERYGRIYYGRIYDVVPVQGSGHPSPTPTVWERGRG
ncbi:MAG: hypothetical protein ACFCBW_06555 [Candidatus Competibacterales bacterium]